jgi:murein DD-endopeptidase MepM/ murein hydrolase activator NlpD
MKKLVKAKLTMLIIFLVVPLMLFLLLIAAILNTEDDKRRIFPAVEEEKALEYKATVEGTPINWANMIVYDTVKYDNDFSKAQPNETAWEFLQVEWSCDVSVPIRDENGNKVGYKWEKLNEGVERDQEEIINFIEGKFKYKGRFEINNEFNSYHLKDIRKTIEVLEFYNRKEFAKGIGRLRKYSIKIKSKAIDEVMKDFDEKKKEWAYALIDENVVYLMFEDLIDLPDHIIVEGENFFAWPTPTLHTVTSPFGWRIHPKTGKKSFHSGVDISGANAKGQPVIASAAGVVMKTEYGNRILGNNIILKHVDESGNEWQTRYAHLSQIKVSEGEIVTQGDVIGAVGNTGFSTGPHLHIEMKYMGQLLNPYPYIQ